MPALISICIPAWERPALLAETVKSCLEQTYANLEILIADDSRSDAVEQVISRFAPDARLRYVRNAVRLGQAQNVNKLFDLAAGERLILLHDDDLLLPEAVEVLDSCWKDHPELVASYGKSYVMTHSGKVLENKSAACSNHSCRTAQYQGLQKSALWAVLAFQFPLDGYMLRTSVARATRLRPYCEVGDSCDIDFALRLAQHGGGFFFLDRYVSKYRITDVSITTESVSDPRFGIVRELTVPRELEPIRQRYLSNIASAAFRRHLLTGERMLAWQILRPSSTSWRVALAAARPSNLLLLLLPLRAIRFLSILRYWLRAFLRKTNAVYAGREMVEAARARFSRTVGNSRTR